MRRFRIGIGIAVLLAFGTAVPASSNSDLTELLGGKSAPLTLKLKDLDGEWKRLSISGQAETGAMMPFVQMISSIIGPMLGGAPGNVYYTKGQTVTIGGETYLAAYRLQSKGLDLLGMMQAGAAGAGAGGPGAPGAPEGGAPMPPMPPMPPKVTADSAVTLHLLNLRSIGSLGDIQPFNMEKEIADSEAAAGLFNMLGGLGSALGGNLGGLGGAATPEVAPPPVATPRGAPGKAPAKRPAKKPVRKR